MNKVTLMIEITRVPSGRIGFAYTRVGAGDDQVDALADQFEEAFHHRAESLVQHRGGWIEKIIPGQS